MNRIYSIIIFTLIILIAVVATIYYLNKKKKSSKDSFDIETVQPQTIKQNLPTDEKTTENKETSSLAEPVADFKARITKKPFGIYITPQNSPVQPEKFTGYHTAVDIEYDDVIEDTTVYAVSDGEVVYAGTVSGYGGMMVLRLQIEDKELLVLYGHLDPNRLTGKGTKITLGQQIGYLGKDKSNQTDGERKHLHFAILKGDEINFHGYVQNENELDNWYNPLDFY